MSLKNYSKKVLLAVIIVLLFLTAAIVPKENNGQSSESNVKTDLINNNTDTIKIEDVATYYQEATLTTADELNALGDEYITFITVTDTHGVSNKSNSQNIIRYLLKNTKADKLFHLGDSVTSTWEKSDFKLYFDSFNNCNQQIFYSLGNHETYSNSIDYLSTIYETLLADKNNLKGNPGHFYYYFDDDARHVRYLVINTSDTSDEQLLWIKENVKLPSDEWKLIVFGHMDIRENDPITHEWIAPRAKDITEALSSTNGTIIGYFCGHEHCDLIQKLDNKFYEVILLNDSCAKDATFSEITNPERVAGTDSEHAVSVVSINTKTGQVDIRRIGAGENITYNYLE